MSWPVSRVLSRTIIHLGPASPQASSDLPESSAGHTCRIPIWSCSERGLPSPQTVASCAVRSYRTFSPLPNANIRRFPFCCTFRRLAPPRRYLAFYPMEPGLSSPQPPKWVQRDCLVNSGATLPNNGATAQSISVNNIIFPQFSQRIGETLGDTQSERGIAGRYAIESSTNTQETEI